MPYIQPFTDYLRQTFFGPDVIHDQVVIEGGIDNTKKYNTTY